MKDKDLRGIRIKGLEEYYTYETSQKTINYNSINTIRAAGSIDILAETGLLLQGSQLESKKGTINLKTQSEGITLEALKETKEVSGKFMLLGQNSQSIEKLKTSISELSQDLNEPFRHLIQEKLDTDKMNYEAITISENTSNIGELLSHEWGRTEDIHKVVSIIADKDIYIGTSLSEDGLENSHSIFIHSQASQIKSKSGKIDFNANGGEIILGAVKDSLRKSFNSRQSLILDEINIELEIKDQADNYCIEGKKVGTFFWMIHVKLLSLPMN